MTTHLERQSDRISARDDDLDHWYCCDPNVSFCGRDISEIPDVPFDVASCVVCESMADTYVCPECDE
jgi:hypothetical protein